MTRIIGPPKSRRRRWTFLWCLAVVIGVGVVYIPGALAVHDEGVFQLDGNAQTSVNSNPAMPAATEDADSICKAHLAGGTAPGEVCHSSPNFDSPPTTAATKSAFVTDAFGSATDNIYTTGGSKDDLDVSSWKFKTAQPSPDKADIEHAFSGIYSAGNGDKLIYFGGDRFSNGGDENTAFWFFQNKVALAGDHPGDATICDTASGCPFSGVHKAAVPGADNCLTPQGKTIGLNMSTGAACTESDNGAGQPSTDAPGDILAVSAFTTGGTVPNITAYEWVGIGAAPKSACVTSGCSVIKILDTSPGCTPTLTGDAACAITNQPVTSPPSASSPGNLIPTPAPWLFTEKDGTINGFKAGDYIEGGLNLTKLGLQGECTSSFLMNTRSSQSVDSSLQDFALGQVGSCQTTLSTAAGNTDNGGTASPTSIGGGTVSSGSDTATLTVTGISTWSGTLSWSLCGPVATDGCDRTKGVQVTSRTVSQASSGADFVSGTANLTSAGRYCWTAHFEPDQATKDKGVQAADDNGANECFTVSPVTPTLTTCADGTARPCVPDGTKNLGDAVRDTADLSGAAKEPGSNGGNANYPSINATNGAFAGSITFTLKGPASSGCGNNATGTGTNPQSVNVTGNITYGPVSFTPNQVGKYHWQATYANANTVNNVLPVSDNASCDQAREDVTIQQLNTTTVTTPSDSSGTALSSPVALGTMLFDKAVVTAEKAGGGDVTGSVTFTICDPSQVSGAAGSEVCVAANGTQVGSAVSVSPIANSNPPASSALSSPGVAANKAGTWCFSATFTPTGNVYLGSSDSSHTECVVVGPEQTTTVTTPSKTSGIVINDTVTDHAVVTATDNADSTPTGTIAFFVCSPLVTSGQTPGQESCPSPLGVAAGSSTATAVANSNPPASEATSNTVTASMVGVWCFRAEYTPGGANGANYLGSSDSSHTECFTVTDSSSVASNQKWLPNDHATLTSTGASKLDGTVDITLHSGTCTGPTVYTEPTFTSPAGGWTSGKTFDTTNTSTFVVNAANNATPYFWRIVFTSTNSFVSGFTKCEQTDITINDNP